MAQRISEQILEYLTVGNNIFTPQTTYNLHVTGSGYITTGSSNSTNAALTLNNGLLKITNYSNTVSIGSQNTGYMHFTNSANIPFYFNKTIWVNGDLMPYDTTNTKSLGSTSNRWKTLYIGTADGYGNGTQPIYWSAGVPVASTSTVGSSTKPVYLSSGTITASSGTVGSGVIPIYMTSGTLTASTSTVGSGVIPMFLSSGTLTASTSTVGSGVKPIYLSSGTLTASTSTVGSGVKPIYLNGGTLTVSSSTVGATNKPIFLSSGTLTASTSTIGSGVKPIYISSGTLTASSSTVGSSTNPVFLLNGTITKTTYGLYAEVDEAPQANCLAYYSSQEIIDGANNILVTQSTSAPAIKMVTTAGGGYAIQGSTYTISLYLGSGGTNRGIYESSPLGDWLLYWDANNRLNSPLNFTYNGRDVTNTIDVNSRTVFRNAAETPTYFINNVAASKPSTHGYYLYQANNQVARWYIQTNTTSDGSAVGEARLTLGNNKAATTAYSACGSVLIYGTGANYAFIGAEDIGANINLLATPVGSSPAWQTTRLNLTSTTDAAPDSYKNVALTLGTTTGTHIEIDNNEILCKTNATTMGTLYLQETTGVIRMVGRVTSTTQNYGGTLPTTNLDTGRIFFKT